MNTKMTVKSFLSTYDTMSDLLSKKDVIADTESVKLKESLNRTILSMKFYINSKLDEDSTEEDVIRISNHMMEMDFLEFCEEVNRDINIELSLTEV